MVLPFLRALILAIYLVLSTAVFGIIIIIDGLIRRDRRLQDLIISTLWGKPLLYMAGIELELRGAERLPQGGGFLYAFNHTSYLDIIVMVTGLPRIPRFGAKIELFAIPIFGPAMRALGNLPITRSNREAVLKIYQEAESRVAKGECFALAPEGTRQDGVELGKFKTGPFIFAINARMPIVPLVISGAGQIMPKGGLMMNAHRYRGKVIMEILEPIPTAQYSLEQLSQLQELARSRMEQSYRSLNRELGYVN